MKQQNIQVPLKLLTNVHILMLMLDNVTLDDETRALCVEIGQQTQKKLDAINKRSAFTSYRMAKTPEEREQYRNKYLDKTGIHPDFRSADEMSFNPDDYTV
jgi:hypothetical protein